MAIRQTWPRSRPIAIWAHGHYLIHRNGCSKSHTCGEVTSGAAILRSGQKYICHISQLFSKRSTMCRPQNATSANFFQKAQLCVSPKNMPHQPTFFKKLNYVSPKNMPHQPTFFKKLNYASPKYATSANFFTNVIWQTFSSHLKLVLVCAACALSASQVWTLKKNYKFLILLKFAWICNDNKKLWNHHHP